MPGTFLWRINDQYSITIGVDNFCFFYTCHHHSILSVNMDVAVKMQVGLKHFDQPIKCLYPLVRPVIHVVNVKWRGMGDENIQVAAKPGFVDQ